MLRSVQRQHARISLFPQIKLKTLTPKRSVSGQLGLAVLCVAVMTLITGLVAGCGRPGERGEMVWHAVPVRQIDLSSIEVPVYSAVSFAVDGKGKVYIPAPWDHHVVVVDTTGEFLYTIGRVGKGPGEFARPTFVELIQDTLLAVPDLGGFKISMFRTSGGFVRSRHVSMGPLLAWSGKFLAANSVKPECLVDLYDSSLELIGCLGDGRMASLDQRLGPGPLLQACQDTVWIVHWRATPVLLTRWVRGRGMTGKIEIAPRSMAQNNALKEETLKRQTEELKRKGMPVGRGQWKHIGAILRDGHGRLWLNYYWQDEDGAVRSVFYVYTSSMELLARVEGFDVSLDCPRFDRLGRLWGLESRGQKLVLTCYRVET